MVQQSSQTWRVCCWCTGCHLLRTAYCWWLAPRSTRMDDGGSPVASSCSHLSSFQLLHPAAVCQAPIKKTHQHYQRSLCMSCSMSGKVTWN
jgi:hypothetical protein